MCNFFHLIQHFEITSQFFFAARPLNFTATSDTTYRLAATSHTKARHSLSDISTPREPRHDTCERLIPAAIKPQKNAKILAARARGGRDLIHLFNVLTLRRRALKARSPDGQPPRHERTTPRPSCALKSRLHGGSCEPIEIRATPAPRIPECVASTLHIRM
ncbi:hypothetical protein DFH09DRAFT_1305131 [Mycena vulgaris]|nr:hypothetical protein DFH09DRAFT_1305131 [Mycena vulgaris]